MFGSSTPFGQSSNNSFGSPSILGRNSNAGSSPFTPKPFGSATPFGSPAGGPMFGGTSTGVFGTNSSPFGQSQHSTFGSPSSPAFGTSTAAVGASSAPAPGGSSSSFGGSSIFGQKPAFGGFPSSPNQSNSFGVAFQQNQTTFGSNPFGSSTSFGASTQNASGAFGGFGMGGAFGAANTSGSASTSIFGVSKTSAIGAPNSPAFGTPSTKTKGFGTTTPTFGQSNSAITSSGFFGVAPSVSGTQSFPGAQSTTPTFGTNGTGGTQHGGSRLAAYTTTPEVDDSRTKQYAAKLQSISAMGNNKGKSHEELRWEDYQLGDKGGSHYLGQSAGGIGTGGSTIQQNSSNPAPTLAQSSVTPFFSSTPSNPFAPQTSSTPFGPPTSSNQFSSQTTSNPFGPQTSSAPFGPQASSNPFSFQTYSNPFAPQTSSTSFVPLTSSNQFSSQTSSNPFAPQNSSTQFIRQTSSNQFPSQTSSNPVALQTSSNPFVTSCVPALSSPLVNTSSFTNSSITSLSFIPSQPVTSSPSLPMFSSNTALGTSSVFSLGLSSANTQSTPIFQSVSPLAQSSSFGPSIARSFNLANISSAPSTGSQLGGNLCPSTPSLLSASNLAGFTQTSSFYTPLQPTQRVQTPGLSGLVGTTGILGQGTSNQPSATQSTVVVGAAPNLSPYGALPAIPQLSISHPASTPSIRYGISTMPVSDKPAAPIRMSSLLTFQHLSQRRIRAPARKYDPKSDGPKVPFFRNDEETPTAPKADALFVQRENPRALVIRPAEQWPQRSNTKTTSPLVRPSLHVHNKNEVSAPALFNDSLCQEEDDHLVQKCIGNHQPNSTIEYAVDVEALMPRLRCSDYYTNPPIHELEVKERSEPGFSTHVKDFVVGHRGYGSIKFLGETDVRQLDLDSHVQFNNREVSVYMDKREKPPVGQGLNKPAEVTLLNIRCVDKKTGKQYVNGLKVEKYREMLMKKATEQGAEFVSYDPVEGEWKFRVQHFSRYTCFI